MASRQLPVASLPLQIKVRIPITQEAVVVAQGMLIDPLPVITQESGNQKQQGALRLMKIGDHPTDNLEFVSRNDNDLS